MSELGAQCSVLLLLHSHRALRISTETAVHARKSETANCKLVTVLCGVVVCGAVCQRASLLLLV
jgi:hypothetical protein